MKRIFNHIGGVPVRLRCDNMTTAVAQILEGSERVITDGFYRFMLHRRFKADFCNPAKGNERSLAPLMLGTEPPLLNYRPDLSVYDDLTTGAPPAGGAAQ